MGYNPWGHKRVRHDLATKQPRMYICRERELVRKGERETSFSNNCHCLLNFSKILSSYVPPFARCEVEIKIVLTWKNYFEN